MSVIIQPIPNSQTGGQQYSDTSPFSIPWLQQRFQLWKDKQKQKKIVWTMLSSTLMDKTSLFRVLGWSVCCGKTI
jgi:hypothetical protein